MEDLKLVERVCRRFTELYGASPRLFRSPGRANLIGEHTDYNDGFVMPFAIDRETVVAAVSSDDRKIRVAALDVNESATIDLDAEPQKLRHRWIDYVEGTARSLAEKHDIGGANIVFASSVPIGAGLSSSAALEVSIGFALLSIYKQQIDLKTLALAAQRAEHEFVGIRSGIMDQFASAFGREGQAMLLDCRSMEIEYIPIDVGDAVIAVCDTKVKHELAATEYNTRREECEKGVEILRTALPHIKALRDVSVTEFKTYEDLLPEPIRSRCRHVVTENERTLEAAELFKAAKLNGVGRLMFESHASLRDDYEVSCPELDTLVDSAQNVDGIYGSRMTGGGFGGCTVNLLRSSALENFRDILTRDYRERFGTIPDIYVFNAADGVSEITL